MSAYVENPLLAAALSGYHLTKPNEHLWSSPMWFAWKAGRAIGEAGLMEPCYPVKMSRGDSVRVNTSAGEYIVKFRGRRLEEFEVRSVD